MRVVASVEAHWTHVQAQNGTLNQATLVAQSVRCVALSGFAVLFAKVTSHQIAAHEMLLLLLLLLLPIVVAVVEQILRTI